MIHLDLFSGIGGFAYALDQVIKMEHIFCEIDPFCQKVLKNHWPNSIIYEDIKLLTDPNFPGLQESRAEQQTNRDGQFTEIELITGGVPCQPASQAGKRKGVNDDRWLWPATFAVIRKFKPENFVLENVRGLVTLEQGLVFENLCLEMESMGYEIQPVIIPACAVNAPHRRDRVWLIAHCKSEGLERSGRQNEGFTREINAVTNTISKRQEIKEFKTTRSKQYNSNVKNSISKRSNRGMESSGKILECEITKTENERPSWEKNWLEVATESNRVDDGLSEKLDFSGYTKPKHRIERIKALGNSIVPQVAIEIFKSIYLIK